MRKVILAAALMVAGNAFAATHIWEGSVSGQFSNAANWIGGSPAGDPNAALSFPASAQRTVLTNDLASLTVRSIAFSGDGYEIGGNAITLASANIVDSDYNAANTISCNLILNGNLTLASSGNLYDASGLRLGGAISGSGVVTKTGSGRVTFAGAAPNTYSGETVVANGEILLSKSANMIALPGNLRLEHTGSYEYGELSVAADEQISDAATLRVGAYSALRIGARETVGPLVVVRGSQVITGLARSGSYTLDGTVVLGGDIEVPGFEGYGDVSFSGTFILPATRTISIWTPAYGGIDIRELRGATPDAGVIVRSDTTSPTVEIFGAYTGPTIVQGANLLLRNEWTAVTMRSGRFAGLGGSVVAEGGVLFAKSYLGGVTSRGELRMNAATDVPLGFYESNLPRLSGTSVTLGGAELQFEIDSNLDHTPGLTYEIISNLGAQPVSGTFAGMPEGTILANRFRLSYVGGTGNDVTLTDISKYRSSIDFRTEGSGSGSGLTLIARVTTDNDAGWVGAGTVTFRNGDAVIAAVTLDALGEARAAFDPGPGEYPVSATYEGNATTDPVRDEMTVMIPFPPPVLTSTDPSIVDAGATVDLILRGSRFVDGGHHITVSGANVGPTIFVSPTELRTTITVADWFEEDSVLYVRLWPDRGGSFSNEITMSVRGNPRPATTLTFEERAIRGPVAAGATSYWLRGAARRVNFSTRFESQSAVVPDSDADGTVRWELADVIPATTIAMMVDGSNGAFHVGAPDGKVPKPLELEEPIFLRDPNDLYSQIITFGGSHTFLWVRPNVGAWAFGLSDNAAPDLDPDFGRIVLPVSTLRPLAGSPAPPSGVEANDVFLAIHDFYMGWYGGRAGDFFGSGPGVIHASGDFADEADGTATITFTRSGGSEGTATVSYTTVDGTATAGVHYAATSGTVTFGDGEIRKTVQIPLIDDAVFGGDTQFEIHLTGATGATVGEATEFAVWLREDDPRPTLALGPDVTLLEGDSGVRTVPISLTLSGATRLPVEVVSWITPGPSRQMTFAPGETSKTIVAGYLANTILEADRIFRVSVTAEHSSLVNITRQTATITIVDDEPLAGLIVLDTTIGESEGYALVRVLSTARSGKPMSVKYMTVAGSAAAGADFTTTTGTIQIEDEATISIPINDDGAAEGTEWLSVVLYEPVNATLRRTTAAVVIADDDEVTGPMRGDFNRDGYLDLFWLHTSGAAYVWNLHGLNLVGSGNAAGPGSGWRAAAISDFDRDGDADVLWQNAQGVNQLWFMDGNNVAATSAVAQAGLVEWRIVASADFDRDGNADLLWQHATTGQLYVWYMNGATFLRGANMNNVGSPDWRVAAVIDANGTAWPRILWRHRTTGQNYMWFLRDNLLTEGTNVQYVPDTGWQIVAAHYGGEAGDYVFWQHTSGALYYWKMIGAATVESGNFNGNGGNGWTVAGPR